VPSWHVFSPAHGITGAFAAGAVAENWCQEGNANVVIGKENYFLRAMVC